MHKIIGTAVPLSALRSNKPDLRHETNGTVDTGLLFLDWLNRTGQNAWQFLPLSETHLEPDSKTIHVPSPYKGYGIGFDARYLSSTEKPAQPSPEQEASFRFENKEWLNDYTLFCALRDHFETDDWSQWDRPIRDRRRSAMKEWSDLLSEQVRGYLIEQWHLSLDFERLKKKAAQCGILLIGDLPFYVPYTSPLVWANRDCFDLRRDGSAKYVSGVPGGRKSLFGRQLWGHPLYDWRHRSKRDRIIGLWKTRLVFLSRFFDIVRLDHTTGFYDYAAMHLKNGKGDKIRRGPGAKAMLDIIACGTDAGLEIIAEDHGDLSRKRIMELRKTLEKAGVSRTKIFNFAFDTRRRVLRHDNSDVRNYPEDCFAYSSTHDTETLTAYVKKLAPRERQHLTDHVGIENTQDVELFVDRILGALISSPAKGVIIPLQDWLHTETRINIPGTEKRQEDRNWRYRIEKPIEKLPDIGLIPSFDEKR